MELLNSTHAVAGFVVALFGLVQILLKKGGGVHAMIGFTYLIAWIIVIFTGLFMGKPEINLIGVFGFHMAFTGWRYASRRRKKPSKFDKVISGLGLVLSLVAIGYGSIFLRDGDSIGWVAMVVGVIFLIITILDVLELIFKKKIRKTAQDKRHWMFEHMTRMYISYIAAMTIFMVVNRIFFEPMWDWILPILIGVPLIVITRMYQAKRMAEKEKVDQS